MIESPTFFSQSPIKVLAMANLLAIEAASDSCSVALHIDDRVIERTEAAPRMHSRLLYPMLNEIMGEAGIIPKQLDAVAFGKGPGSFTGLRIAAATAQGIGFACDLPLIGISTLQAMAQQANHEHHAQQALAIMDARMNELYVGHYCWDDQSQLMQATINDQTCSQSSTLQDLKIEPSENMMACGHGLKLTEKLDSSIQEISKQDANQVLNASSLLPLALHLFKANKVLKPENVELSYLREQSHWKTIKQQKEFKEQLKKQ